MGERGRRCPLPPCLPTPVIPSTGSPSSATKTVRLFNEGYEKWCGFGFHCYSRGAPLPDCLRQLAGAQDQLRGGPTSDGGGSLFEGFPPLDSPSSVSTGSPSHVKNPAAATGRSSLSRGILTGQGTGTGTGTRDRDTALHTAAMVRKEGRKEGKANAGANVVAMDVSDSPGPGPTRPTRRLRLHLLKGPASSLTACVW